MQAQLPYVFRTAGDAGGNSVSGFGDPQWELILAAPVRGSKVVRLELALGGFIKVAPPDRGNGAWIMQPTVGASFNMSRQVQLITVVTYQYSFGADSGVAPTSSLLGQVFALWQPISHSYIILQLNPGVDLIGDQFVHNAQLQFGRFLNKEHTIGPWVQFALNTGEKNTIYPYSFQFQAGLSWLFPEAAATSGRARDPGNRTCSSPAAIASICRPRRRAQPGSRSAPFASIPAPIAANRATPGIEAPRWPPTAPATATATADTGHDEPGPDAGAGEPFSVLRRTL